MGKRRISTSESTDSSSEDDARILRKKLRKYKRKYERQKGRSITPETPDPDSDKENGATEEAVIRRSRESSLEPGEGSHQLSRVFLPVVEDDGNQATAQDECDPLSVDNVNAPLDEGILKLLGSKDSVKEKVSPGIHNDLALRWTIILKNGLEDGIRSDLLNKYPPVKNCLLMAAPKLNREVKAAITEPNLKRDDRLAGVQAQVGASLSALGRALNILFEEKEGGEDLRMRLIEIMSDSARLLADVHFQESQTRRNILSLGLKKDLSNTLSDVAVDGWLFGDNLGERVKTARAIEQSGKELKGDKLNKRKNIPYKSSLNSKGPSRYSVPASRLGGQKHSGHNKRGGERQELPTPRLQIVEEPRSRQTEESVEVAEVGFTAGRISSHLDAWKQITKDPIILSWVKGYTIPFLKRVKQGCLPRLPKWSISEKTFINSEILRLTSLGAISKCKAANGQFISNIFVVPKRGGKLRLILNLKSLNKFVALNHFKLEDKSTVCRLISAGSFMATLDIQDAYFLINIDIRYRKYLRFRFNNYLYEFNCVPFGLSSAPFVYTKIMKPVISVLREKGFLSVSYLDDLLLFGDSYSDCMDNIKNTINVLESLGFIINFEKSILTPTTSCKFLGFIFDSRRMKIKLPDNKRSKVYEMLRKLLGKKSCTIRSFARVVGVIVSICPAAKYGWLYSKKFERAKYLALKRCNSNYDKIMQIPQFIYEDIKWWQRSIFHTENFIGRDNFQLEIFSDSSSTGWGIFCKGERASGQWTETERSYHINYLELLSAFFGLKCYASTLFGVNILLRIDNTTAISYINRMGGIRFENLNELTRKIWQWCESRNLWIFASYIRSKDNVEADEESRKVYLETEYELAHEAFEEIVKSLGHPDIDLFASRANTKCVKYASWKQDPDCFVIDAFTINWAGFYFYAFPPFSMILPMLRKIVEDKAHGIVVVPFWVAQPWFPLFKKILRSEPLYFSPRIDLLLSVDRSPHPLWQSLTLVAGVV